MKILKNLIGNKSVLRKNQAQYFAFNHNSADCRNFRIARCVNTFALCRCTGYGFA